MKKIWLYCIFAIFLSGCIAPKPQDFVQSEFVATNLKTQKELNFGEFIDEISKFDIIILGESHKDNASRFLESKIIEEIAKNHSVTAVLEMIDDSRNEAMQKAKLDKKIYSQRRCKKP